jgi:hypothetical protein
MGNVVRRSEIRFMKKLLIASWVPLVILAASCQRNGPRQVPSDKSGPGIQGELIDAAPVPQTGPVAEAATNVSPKNKHPKPPSLQRRMVLAEMAVLSQSNYDSASLPSGTAGTAADLAKTNLPSIASLAGASVDVPGYQNISFNILAGFDFSLTPEMADGTASPPETAAQAGAQIPVKVQSLDGKEVAIQGFLLPVTMNNGLAVEFLLMRNQSMCCYGVPPNINEWITVRTAGPGVKPVMDQPITVAGTLRVGPILENGALAGIYHLEAKKIVAPF